MKKKLVKSKAGEKTAKYYIIMRISEGK